MCNGYSGYNNYPTWCVSLWLDNDQGWYNVIEEKIEEFVDEVHEEITLEKTPDFDLYVNKLADWLEEEIESSKPDTDGMWSDLMSFVWDKIDWREIAELHLDNSKPEFLKQACSECSELFEEGTLNKSHGDLLCDDCLCDRNEADSDDENDPEEWSVDAV